MDMTDIARNIEHINAGKIYITVPSYNFLWSLKDIYSGHFRRYTIKVYRSVEAALLLGKKEMQV
jgi:hypothetical protein